LLPLVAEREIISLPSASVLAELRREAFGRKPAEKAVAVIADPVFEADDPRLKSVASKGRSGSLVSAASPATELRRAATEAGITRDDTSGFPRLIATRREAAAILSAVPSSLSMRAFDFEASRVTAKSPELARYRFIHFATHGLLNAEHPELSGLILSLIDRDGHPVDGFLRLHEIYDLKLPAELVVLSACSTGLGKEVKGEGLVGLTRGFMYAGTPRVVASLWKVDDTATSELMANFYRGMLKNKLRPAAALRAAQIEMLKQPLWRSPYYWAAFVLQGEWK
jgi:CHAT domain-containing protein